MTAPLARPATQDALFLWVMHRFSEVFEEHAVIKGGMALRLLDSSRNTMDIDYVFVPFTSKKEILNRVRAVLDEIEDASIDVSLHSKMMRAELKVDEVVIVVEANVATECESTPMATGGFANSLGQPSQIVRIMDPDWALANKIAAWNERRILRDLYDCYFLVNRAGAQVDLGVLDSRLEKVQSRLPSLKKVRRMSRDDLAQALTKESAALSDEKLAEQLAAILPPEELAGLVFRIRSAVEKIITILRDH